MSVATQQQYQSLQGTKVYVVDPEKLRQKVILKSFQVGKSSAAEGNNSVVPAKESGKAYYEKKPRKRRLEGEEAGGGEDEDDSLYAKFYSKEVTTRAGRVSKTKQPGSQSKVAKASEIGPKIKKREPANVFRCPSCQKVYIGYSKLKLHFRKFPNHCKYGEESCKDLNIKLRKVPESSTTETQTELRLDKHKDVAVQTSVNEFRGSETETTTVQNQSFPSFQLLLNSSQYAPPPSANQISAGGGLLRSTFSHFSSYKSDCELNRALGNNSSPENQTSHCAGEAVFGQLSLPAGSNQNAYAQQVGAKHINNPVLMSPTILKHTSNHHNDHIQNVGFSLQRLVWDVVEEKMIQHGINEILNELSDVAEKLAKIARDKIIPIREEEEEQLRVNNTAPIVQVDTPFLSHLLDLPFGTYMFKEDAGIRRLIPPPVAADLSLNSLTSGVEVDIDKFLPGIDIIHLPHLTNIDFSSICNDAQLPSNVSQQRD